MTRSALRRSLVKSSLGAILSSHLTYSLLWKTRYGWSQDSGRRERLRWKSREPFSVFSILALLSLPLSLPTLSTKNIDGGGEESDHHQDAVRASVHAARSLLSVFLPPTPPRSPYVERGFFGGAQESNYLGGATALNLSQVMQTRNRAHESHAGGKFSEETSDGAGYDAACRAHISGAKLSLVKSAACGRARRAECKNVHEFNTQRHGYPEEATSE